MSVDRQLEWSEAELLATHAVAEPVVVGGRRCHGGFDGAGNYVSPRTVGRTPAIRAWQANHRVVFGTEIAVAPLDEWPHPYPNLAQAQLLLRHGVTAPIATILTRIGTVEGFGGLIRTVGCGDVRPHLAEPIDGTALAHLETGLFEAHARDETGFGDELGHKEMWFAARDIAFDRAFSADETSEMMLRMGVPAGPPGREPQASGGGAAGTRSELEPLFPEVDQRFESMLRFMVALMFIEVSAFHVFVWAEQLLDDHDLCAGDGTAADLVRYIRRDETPHVEYLRTAVTEVRDRAVRTGNGGELSGATFVDRIWRRARADSLGPRRTQSIELTNREVERALAGVRGGGDILAEFHALADDVAARPEGREPQASGGGASPEGREPQASGGGASPEGREPQASGGGASPEGREPQASGGAASPEGREPQASGGGASPEGREPQASGGAVR